MCEACSEISLSFEQHFLCLQGNRARGLWTGGPDWPVGLRVLSRLGLQSCDQEPSDLWVFIKKCCIKNVWKNDDQQNNSGHVWGVRELWCVSDWLTDCLCLTAVKQVGYHWDWLLSISDYGLTLWHLFSFYLLWLLIVGILNHLTCHNTVRLLRFLSCVMKSHPTPPTVISCTNVWLPQTYLCIHTC